MCLSAREQRRLDSIGEAARRSDARLSLMMVTFGQPAAGEPMPEREQLAATPGRAVAALHAAAAAVAEVVTWLDCVDSPRPRQERPDRERRAI
jgi:hypothetical protein